MDLRNLSLSKKVDKIYKDVPFFEKNVKMEKIAIYGKGGIGKSTIASNLSYIYAKKGMKVLHVGCDPKHDSTINITDKRIKTVMETGLNAWCEGKKEIITKGVLGIDCIECGGPTPGVGCAGRGVLKMFEIIEEEGILKKGEYDIVLFDVLGDVVCGGFAAPLKAGFADKVFIVTSEEIMSLYAANNIIHAVKTYEANEISLGGIIVNVRDNSSSLEHIKKFSEYTNTKILSTIPRDNLIGEAEKQKKTVIEKYPSSDVSKKLEILAEKILEINKKKSLKPRIMGEKDWKNVVENR